MADINIVGELPKLVNGIAGNILSYALILASVATITMTFLELVKSLFKLRCSFHVRRVRNWIKNEVDREQLIVLCAADVKAEDALFDQATDKLMAQVQAAANIVVEYPDTYPELYVFFTNNPLTKDKQDSDPEIWRAYKAIKLSINSPIAPPNDQAAAKARANVDHFVTRRLDAFQSQTEYLWARKNQYYSVILSGLFLLGLLLYIKVPLIWALPLALAGGMISPFAKDVVSGLSGIKTK